jgi:transposase
VFLDEFGCNISMVPRHGRARSGDRVHMNKPRERGRNITVAGAMSLEGVIALAALPGSTTIVNFLAFVQNVLIPVLRAGQIVVMDNLRAHRNDAVVAAIEAAGVHVMFLPAYSPEYNPIEECWSKLKNILRKVQARTEEALYDALDAALNAISASDIIGWVRHAGYSV